MEQQPYDTDVTNAQWTLTCSSVLRTFSGVELVTLAILLARDLERDLLWGTDRTSMAYVASRFPQVAIRLPSFPTVGAARYLGNHEWCVADRVARIHL